RHPCEKITDSQARGQSGCQVPLPEERGLRRYWQHSVPGANGARVGRKLLGFWGLPNLQVFGHKVHSVKCATDAFLSLRSSIWKLEGTSYCGHCQQNVFGVMITNGE